MPSSKKHAATAKPAKPLTPAEQHRRFEEMSRELGCDNGEALNAVFGKIVPPKVPKPSDKKGE